MIDLDETPTQTETETIAPSVASVPSSWPQASSWKFEAFSLEITPWHCQNCHDEVLHSQLFRMFVRHFPNTTDRRFVPATEFVPHYPVIKFERKTHYTHICAKCVNEASGTKNFRICDENEFKLAALRAQEEAKKSQTRRSATVTILSESKARVAQRLENLL